MDLVAHDRWNLPRPGIELVFPALASRFLTPGPSQMPCFAFFCFLKKKKRFFSCVDFFKVFVEFVTTSLLLCLGF